MRKRTQRRILAATHNRDFAPTPDMRELVKLLVFNGTPEARMAEGLGLTVEELQYYFADELGYSQDRLLAETAAKVISHMRQSNDPGISLRAAEIMLRTRLPVWREPKAEEPKAPPLERVEELTLEEVRRELARLRASPAEPSGEDPEPEGGASSMVH